MDSNPVEKPPRVPREQVEMKGLCGGRGIEGKSFNIKKGVGRSGRSRAGSRRLYQAIP